MRRFLKNGGLLAFVLVFMMVLVLVLPVHAAANRGPIELPMIPGGSTSTTAPTTEPATTEPVTEPATDPTTEPATEPATTVPQETVPTQCLSYKIVDGEVTITDCDENAFGELIIPDAIEGYPVTSIGDFAFYSCKSLTSMTIPDSVISISDSAFRECTSLTSVTIPDSVISIGSNAFSWCVSLTTVTLPVGVTSIGDYMFFCCTSLTSVTIPNSVTSIGYRAFSRCASLTSATLSDSVTSIGNEAFYGCTNLTLVMITDSVTSIGDYAFSECTSLTGLYVDDNNAYYSSDDRGVLFNKEKTSLIQVPESISGYYTIPDSVTSIGNYAFYSCSGLTSVTIPDSVTSIGEGVFYECASLNSVTIPNSVTNIGYEAFCKCASLTSVTIPDSATSIGISAFSYCTGLTDVYYSGTQTQWTYIHVGTNNAPLTDATIHYNHTHDYTQIEPVTVAPTCTEAGYIEYTCVHGETYREIIQAALGHNIVDVPAVEPTCTKDGHSAGTQCQRCEIYMMTPTVKPALGHSYGKWTVTKEATATAQGSKRRDCTRCDHYQTAVIPKLPAVKTQPTNANLPAGKTAKFTIKVTGEGLTYQWQYRTSAKGSWKNASATGNKTATMSVTVTAARNGYQYRCKVTDKEGSVVYSKAATLKVVTLKVTTQPANKYLPAGKTAKFTVKVSGTGLKYQWQYRTSAKGSWKAASATGNKTATVSVPATASRNGYQYRCKITDKYGNVIYSNAATLKIVTLKITTQPSSVTLAKGKTATFKVVAKGTGLTYQWQFRTSAKGSWKKATGTGNKTASLKVPVTAARNGYQYRCVITDKYGNVINSNAATLKVK